MTPEERQRIINNNRSLRNIKNELENLLEHGGISDDQFMAINKELPSELSLADAAANKTQAAAPVSPSLSQASTAVPSVPFLPQNTGPELDPQTGKPIVGHATALYDYHDPNDCNFHPGDEVLVLENLNAEWSMGQNKKTGKRGMFPTAFVQMRGSAPPAYNEKHGAPWQNNGYYGQQNQGPPPPGPSSPYDSAVPPMQMTDQPGEHQPGKAQQMGKKFGRKLGNAAIFGAGATIGSDLVNSIF